MLASLLLTFREGLEAALVVGIILGYLHQIGHADRRRWVWAAVSVAVALSIVLAVGLHLLNQSFEGTTEYLFEGFAMLLAVVVLTWMIFWMRAQARHIKPALHADIQVAVRQRHNWALFGLAFLAVFREGVETALFLTAASFVSSELETVTGGLIGLTAAVVIGWLLYTGAARLNVRRFFDVTSVLLLVFAAGLFAHGIHEFQEAGWLPVFIEHVWDIKSIASDETTLGATLRVLVGYNDNPSLLEVVAYLGYWVGVLVAVNWWANRRAVEQPLPSGA
ncbi:MAG: iron permease [Chloroflexi bacterium]|nr:iron permease [Chloroflexota bacterium]